MNISGKTLWQQASGDTDRNYSDLCLRWDVILNGPGHDGPWPECIESLREIGTSERKIADLKRFCEEIKDEDIVVLRLGTSSILGVGQVVGDYLWSDEFGDIDGWKLQHIRRVRWLRKYEGNPKKFDSYALKLGDTTQKLDLGAATTWLSSLQVPDGNLNRPLVDLPASSHLQHVSIYEVSEYLFDQGVASGSIARLLDEIGELIRIAKWYARSSNPSEHETVAYLVVPLLRSLGWTPQRMAIEWNHVDVALFDQLPRNDRSLTVVVEAKKMDASCLSAKSQAMSYANDKPSCHRLIVTDGLRYGVYVRKGAAFSLYAYMNLTDLRHDYAVYDCKGAKDALLAMAPEWRP